MADNPFDEYLQRNDTETGSEKADTGPLSAREAARLATQAAARYYDRAHQFRFEPFRNFSQFLILCGIIAALLLLLYFWRSVLKVCVGDDRIRMDRFQFVYWFLFQCCGCCDGEWTRCISANCCWCCPDWRGRNLKRKVGESLGLYPVSIRVQNIILGGLPQDRYAWFPKSPDLYVQVVADENSPTLNTEVVSEANTECVQFTSTLTLLVKNNPSDDPVRFFVKKMHLTGSSEVADCSVNPARLVMWAQSNRRVRISLGGTCRKRDPMCMPWIMLDLSLPPEAVYLRKEVGIFAPIFQAHSDHSRTLEFDDREYHNPNSGLLCGADDGDGVTDLPLNTSTGFYAITDATKFMELHPLMNSKGQQVNEDRDLAAMALLNKRSWFAIIALWVVLLLVAFVLLRVFTAGCHEQFEELEAMRLESHRLHRRFRPDKSDIRNLVDEVCYFPPLALGILLHVIHVDSRVESACFPRLTRETCSSIKHKATPKMFLMKCPSWTCPFDEFLRDREFLIFFVTIICIIALAMCRMWESHLVHREILSPPSKRERSVSNRRISSVLA